MGCIGGNGDILRKSSLLWSAFFCRPHPPSPSLFCILYDKNRKSMACMHEILTSHANLLFLFTTTVSHINKNNNNGTRPRGVKSTVHQARVCQYKTDEPDELDEPNEPTTHLSVEMARLQDTKADCQMKTQRIANILI